MPDLQEQIDLLKKDSHPPVDIAPRIHDELDRMVILAKLFYEVPTEDLEEASRIGLDIINIQFKSDERSRR